MATSAVSQPEAALPMRQRLVVARLLTLLRLARVSGALAYQRLFHLTEMHRRLISLIGNFGGLNSAELVRLTGSDKAQISRAVKALAEAGLIERAGLRATIQLSPEGEVLFRRIMEVAQERDQAIARDIGKSEIKRFEETTAHLTRCAAQLLTLERQCSGEGSEGDAADAVRDRQAGPGSSIEVGSRPLSRMLVPPLITLVSYLQRSATVAYKRETGISQFEWQILSQVAEHAPISLAELILITGRDKSHIGRTMRRLVETGAVEQRRVPKRRETILTPTAEGSRIYDVMCAIAVRRDDFLFAALPDGTREDYVATIDRMTANAQAMLDEELGR